MFQEGTVWSLVLEADIVSQAILIILVLMSVASWGVIFLKWHMIRLAIKQSYRFNHIFMRGKKLNDAQALADRFPYSYHSKQLAMLYREYIRFAEKFPDSNHERRQELANRVKRIIEKSTMTQGRKLESGLIILASVSGSAPFIGLLGTVIGIINAFHDIGTKGVTSLAVVAPGISEALVATAMGLFAAIPALLGYNYFRNQIRNISNEMKTFGLELLNRFDWAYSQEVNNDRRR